MDLFQVICNCDAEEFAFLKDDKDTERRLVQGSNPDTENKSFDLLFAVRAISIHFSVFVWFHKISCFFGFFTGAVFEAYRELLSGCCE